MEDYVNEDERYRLRGVTETINLEVYEISEEDIQAACDYLDMYVEYYLTGELPTCRDHYID